MISTAAKLWALAAFNLIALVALGYVVYELVYVNTSIADQQLSIRYVTGTSYMLLMSIFFLFSVVEYAGAKKRFSWLLRHASQLVIGWFVLTLVLAFLIPFVMQNRLEKAGYVGCENPRVISRVSRGESLIYVYQPAYAREYGLAEPTQASVCQLFAANTTNAL